MRRDHSGKVTPVRVINVDVERGGTVLIVIVGDGVAK